MTTAQLNQQLEQAQTAITQTDYTQAMTVLESLLAQSEPHKMEPAVHPIRWEALRQYGRLRGLHGDAHAALRIYHQLRSESQTDEEKTDALSLIGGQEYQTGQYQESIASYQKALHLAEAINYTAGRAEALGGIGSNLRYQGRTEEAIGTLNKALSLYRQLQDVKGQINSHIRISIAYYTLGAVDKTINALQEGLELARAADMPDRVILTQSNLGECYQSLYDIENALTHHRAAYEMAHSLQLRHFQTDTARNLGVDLLYDNQIEAGIAQLEAALHLCEEIGDMDIMGQTLFSLARAEIEHGDREKGKQYARRLQEMADNTESRIFHGEAQFALGLYHQAIGETALAQELWQQTIFKAHESLHRRLLWQIHVSLARIADSPSLAAVHWRIAAEILEQIIYPIEDETLRQKFFSAAPVQEVIQHSDGVFDHY